MQQITKSVVTAIVAVLLTTSSLHSQAIIEPSPQITTSARGQVKISPDRATIHLSVQTKAATAAAAGAENARRQQAVLEALRGLGLKNEDLSTINYTVYPEQFYEPNRPPVISGYNVSNTIVAEITRLTLVGPVIDAALAHGANAISSLVFSASNTDNARRRAIGQAVEQSRADAQAAAGAAGGALGDLIELNISQEGGPSPRPMMMMRTDAAMSAPETPINPGLQEISVSVSTRWRFKPSH